MSLAYLSSRPSRWLVGISALLALPAAIADERVQVVTSFSILADMVENVGGEHVEVTSLVAADGDAHVYSPSPGDARSLADADLVVFNGLLFEGWMERLISASDYSGALVTATNGIEPPRDLLSIKKSKKGTLKQIVPTAPMRSSIYRKWPR